MSNFERSELEKAVKLLDNWLHNGKLDKPRQSLLDAMHTAVKVMQKADEKNYSPMYTRVCAVLAYHITHSDALLFRDPVTLGAIKAAITVLEDSLGWRHI